jgi:hypothetical protein
VKQLKRISLFIAAFAVSITAVSCSSQEPTPAATPAAAEAEPTSTALATSTMDPVFAFDIFDQKQLVGASENVFVGTVASTLGSQTLSGYPSTQFAVDVVSNLKGELAGSVVVNQPGGIDTETNELVLFEDDALLEVGKSYILVSEYNTDNGWHTITPIAGHIELTDTEAEAVENAPNARGASLPPAVLQMQDSIAQEVNPLGAEPLPGLVLPEQPLLTAEPTAAPTETPAPTSDTPVPSEIPSVTPTESVTPSTSTPPR